MKTCNRERFGWYLYDWGNSAFYTAVVTLLFGPFLTEELAGAAANRDGYIYPFGLAVYAPSYWGYLVALAVIVQVILLPVAGAIADRSRRKKELLGGFAYAGAAATVAMYFLARGAYLAGGLLFVAANLCFGASIVIYNSFLPDIAGPQERDAVSSKGWGIGYLGGGLLLAFNLLLFRNAAALGLTEAAAARLSFLSAGAWWAVFTLPAMLWLKNRASQPADPGRCLLTAGFVQLARTLRQTGNYPQTLLFLLAYMLYNDAIQAVIALSGQFGRIELGMEMSTLALAMLMVQFVAFAGALAFNEAARGLGAKRAVMLSLAVWTGVLVAIYFSVRTAFQFFLMAAVVALVLGGSQALSRSLYSQMIPKGKEAEYFSLYEISEKGTSWLAPALFGLALQFTRSYRLAILSLILFFVLGLAVLWRVDVGRAARDAAGDG